MRGIHTTVSAAAFHNSMGSCPETSTGVGLGSKGWVRRLVSAEVLVAFRFGSASRLEARNEGLEQGKVRRLEENLNTSLEQMPSIHLRGLKERSGLFRQPSLIALMQNVVVNTRASACLCFPARLVHVACVISRLLPFNSPEILGPIQCRKMCTRSSE